MSRIILIFLGLAICDFAENRAFGKVSLGLKDTLELAIKKAKALEALRVEREIALGELETAENAWLPRLELDSTLSAGAGAGYDEQALGHSTGLYLRSALYDAGNMQSSIRDASADLVIKDLEIRLATEELLLSVLNSFGQLRLLRSSLAFEEESYGQLKEQALAIERSYKQGLKRQADYVKVELDLRSAEIRLAKMKAEISLNQTEISQIVGLGFAETVNFNVEDWPQLVPAEVPPIPAWSAIESNIPESMLLNARRDLESARARFARRANYPDVTAQAFAGLRNNLVGDDFVNDRDNSLSTEVSVTLKYPIWDWGERNRDILAALSREKIAEINREEALLRLRANYERLVAERVSVTSQLRLAREIQKRAEQSFELSKESYRRGSLSYLELADSYKRLFDAKQSILFQESALQTNINQVLKLRGKLYETWFP